jgi:hypothetical protein
MMAESGQHFVADGTHRFGKIVNRLLMADRKCVFFVGMMEWD